MHHDTSHFRRFGPHGRRFARPGDADGGPFDAPPGGRGWRHGGGPGYRGGRGGLGRFFAHGDLRLVVLNLIARKPSHGYEIIKAIEDGVGGAYTPSPGVIYPTLTLLEELGYVTVSTDGESAKKRYAITPEGESYLAANRKPLDALLERMDAAGRAHRAGASPQVVRAMENLKLALKLRLARGELTAEQIAAVAAALDAAALTVEKV